MKKCFKKNDAEQDQNPFALSTGDMMSALMFIFVLLLSAMMLRYQEKTSETEEMAQKREQLIEAYQNLKVDIKNTIEEELGDSLKAWNAVLDSNLTIVFDERISFDPGKSNLKPEFKSKMEYFFPRYLNSLMSKPNIKASIEELRIEGHTDSARWVECCGEDRTLNTNYICNMQLSQSRSRNVLKYGLDSTGVDGTVQDFLRDKIVATGFSFSHPRKDGKDNKRVEFRIRTNAESKMQEILEDLKKTK